MVSLLLTFKPEQRPNANQLLRHSMVLAKAKQLGVDLNPRLSASSTEDKPMYEQPGASQQQQYQQQQQYGAGPAPPHDQQQYQQQQYLPDYQQQQQQYQQQYQQQPYQQQQQQQQRPGSARPAAGARLPSGGHPFDLPPGASQQQQQQRQKVEVPMNHPFALHPAMSNNQVSAMVQMVGLLLTFSQSFFTFFLPTLSSHSFPHVTCSLPSPFP